MEEGKMLIWSTGNWTEVTKINCQVRLSDNRTEVKKVNTQVRLSDNWTGVKIQLSSKIKR